MKMTATQIERTLHQLDARPIPAEHPMMPQLERLFGDHTYFLDNRGLNIVEPVDVDEDEGHLGVVVNLASWSEANSQNLQAHEPELTDLTVDLDPESRH
jgi:hypothetical protein